MSFKFITQKTRWKNNLTVKNFVIVEGFMKFWLMGSVLERVTCAKLCIQYMHVLTNISPYSSISL